MPPTMLKYVLVLLLIPLGWSECNRPCYKGCRTLSPSSACEVLCTCYFAWSPSDHSQYINTTTNSRYIPIQAGNVPENSGKPWKSIGECEKMCGFGENCDVYCSIYLGFFSFSSLFPLSLLLSVCFCFLVKRHKADSAIDPSPLLPSSPYP